MMRENLDLPRIILLSGAICSGKSTVAKWLESAFSFRQVKTSELLRTRARPSAPTRRQLQNLGQRLDSKEPDWLLTDFSLAADYDPMQSYVVDSIRIEVQAKLFRKAFGRRVIHIHLEAPEEVLKERFANRSQTIGYEPVTYESVRQNRTEQSVGLLSSSADISINTHRCREEDVQVRLAGLLGLRSHTKSQLVDVLVGGQYGSEGKGNVVAYLAPDYSYLLRVGGPNAGHQAVNELGEVYTYRQLPSGTGSSEAKLIIGPGATIDVDILMREIMDHRVEVDRLFIDPNAIIISEENKQYELDHFKNTIASTASGSGHAAAMRILNRELPPENAPLAINCKELSPYIRNTSEILEFAYRKREKILLEGTQGTGLSIFHGHYPYVTSRDTTVSGCLSESGISPSRVRKIIMVCRTYPIRVANPTGGSSGPMAPEVTREELSRRSGLPVSEIAELTSVTKKERRISEFDWELLKNSVALNSPTDIALTFADYISEKNREAYRYDQLTQETINFIEELERITQAKVSLISTKFNFRSIIDRRTWR